MLNSSCIVATVSISTGQYSGYGTAQATYSGPDRATLTNNNFIAAFTNLRVTGGDWRAIELASIEGISYAPTTGIINVQYKVVTSAASGCSHGSTGTIIILKSK